MRLIVVSLLSITPVFVCGCEARRINRMDREVYRLIEGRQEAALGDTHDVRIDREDGETSASDRMYSFNPNPVEPGVPEPFRKPAAPVESPEAEGNRGAGEDSRTSDIPTSEEPNGEQPPAEQSQSIFSEDQLDNVTVFSLRDALAYSMRHARSLQDAKEELYLAALDLTLERHLWTPQFVASVRVTYDDLPVDSDLDRALLTVSEAAVTQRLPFGGEVSARVVHSLLRQVRELVERGESGQVILDARIPLLRGAGRVAYESRYLAERELIYAVRRYERFRRTFLVDIAAEFFNLQQTKASIANTFKSYLSQKRGSDKADFMLQMARIDIFQASRAKASFRRAESSLVSTKERYESALDRFKIRIGMAVGVLLDAADQETDESGRAVDDLLPDIDQETAVDVAVRYRLDLLNSADRIDDARRGVSIAKNRILPDLDVSGSLTLDSDLNQLRSTNFRRERATWRGGVDFRLDDRKTERNAYRASLISLRRAQRDYEEFTDSVRADARRALRRIAQQEDLRRIETLNVHENELRLEAAIALFDLGKKTNQDVVDTENELLTARNGLAAAEAAYRVAILDFRADTGTLRVTDDGRWETPDPFGVPTEDPEEPGDGS